MWTDALKISKIVPAPKPSFLSAKGKAMVAGKPEPVNVFSQKGKALLAGPKPQEVPNRPGTWNFDPDGGSLKRAQLKLSFAIDSLAAMLPVASMPGNVART